MQKYGYCIFLMQSFCVLFGENFPTYSVFFCKNGNSNAYICIMKANTLSKAEEAKRLYTELHKPQFKKRYTQGIVGQKLFVSDRTVRTYLSY